jgi:hypothetical protein
VIILDFTKMTVKERSSYCQNIYRNEGDEELPNCSDHLLDNQDCGSICCGYCPDYTTCDEEKCRKVWINPHMIMDNPVGRLIYVVLDTGQLVTGSIPCIISEMYDDNE